MGISGNVWLIQNTGRRLLFVADGDRLELVGAGSWNLIVGKLEQVQLLDAGSNWGTIPPGSTPSGQK